MRRAKRRRQDLAKRSARPSDASSRSIFPQSMALDRSLHELSVYARDLRRLARASVRSAKRFAQVLLLELGGDAISGRHERYVEIDQRTRWRRRNGTAGIWFSKA